MIFEPNPQFAEFLKIALQKMEFPELEIFHFEQEKEAIASLAKNNFDLLLISFNISSVCGISIFKPEFGEGLPLSKPFNEKKLRSSVNKLLLSRVS